MNDLWKAFEKTGSIESYMLWKNEMKASYMNDAETLRISNSAADNADREQRGF